MIKILFFILIITKTYSLDIHLEPSTITEIQTMEDRVLADSKNITTISYENIDQKDYKNLEAVLRDAPHVIIQNTYFGPVIDMRGNGERALSKVKVFSNGISINPLDDAMGSLPLNTLPTNTIEKIEIIPGGSAVLYGSGTTGGVVNITNNWTNTKDLFNFEYGKFSYDMDKISVSNGIHLNKDLYVSLGYTYLNGSGYRQGDYTQSNIFNGTINYQIDKKNRLQFQTLSFTGIDNQSTPVKKTLLNSNRRISGFPIENEIDRYSYSLKYEFDLSENFIISTIFYNQNFKKNFLETSLEYNLPIEMFNSFQEKNNGIKIKGEYKFLKNELIFGYDYSTTTLIRNTNIDINRHFIDISLYNDIKKNTDAFYTLNKYLFSEELHFLTGFRYERSKYSAFRKSMTHINFAPPGNKNANEDSQSLIEDNFAIELGASYSYSETGNIYSRYEKGFTSPLPNQLTNKTQDGKYLSSNIKSETSDTFEVGLKDFFINSYVKLSVFKTFTDNEIDLIQGNVYSPATKWWTYYNIDRTKKFGAELYLEQDYGKLISSQSLMYVDTEETMVPKEKFTLNLSYQFTKKFLIGAIYNYLGSSQIQEYNSKNKIVKTTISSYDYTDLFFLYKASDILSIKIGINNFFNQNYNYLETFDSAVPAPKRNYYIAGSISF